MTGEIASSSQAGLSTFTSTTQRPCGNEAPQIAEGAAVLHCAKPIGHDGNHAQGHVSWGTLRAREDVPDDLCECNRCGDEVGYLSTDGLCDGCVAEEQGL